MKATAYFTNIENHLISLIRNSKSSIKIVVAWLTSVEIFGELIEASSKDVKVSVILSNSDINFQDNILLNKLSDSGAEIFIGRNTSPFIHHKFAIFDNKYLVNGSYNYTWRAKTKNEENIIVFEFENDSEILLSQFQKRFENLRTFHSNTFSQVIINESVSEYYLITNEVANIELRVQFDIEIRSAIDKTQSLGIKLNHDYLRVMLAKYGGGVLLVKKIIKDEIETGYPKSGFIKIIESGHPELTMEYIAQLPQFRVLFTEDELTFCRKILRR